MTSINFNQSSMVALDTLRGINSELSSLQDQISTGKKINTAKDNASIWSIAKTMDSDVSAFGAVTESLGLASSTIGTARSASESITDLLIDVQDLVVQAQNKNSDDRTKIQADIDNLESQVADIVDASQFNGVNLLKGSESIDFLSSFNRSDSGVSTDTIAVARNNLEVTDSLGTSTTYSAGTIGTQAAVTGVNAINTTLTQSATNDREIFSVQTAATVAEGDVLRLSFAEAGGGTTDVDYQVQSGDDLNGAIDGLIDRVNAAGLSGVTDLTRGTSGGDTVITADFAADSVFTITSASAQGTESSVTAGTAGTERVDGVTQIVNTAYAAGATVNAFIIDPSATIEEGDRFELTLADSGGSRTVGYTAASGDAVTNILQGLQSAITDEVTAGNLLAADIDTSSFAIDTSSADRSILTFTADAGGGGVTVSASDSGSGVEVAAVAGNVGVDPALAEVNVATTDSLDAATGTVFSIEDSAVITEGQVFRVSLGGTDVDYTATGSDATSADIIAGVTNAINTAGVAGVGSVTASTGGATDTISVDVTGGNTYAVTTDSAEAVATTTSATAGLFQLSQIDVTTDEAGALTKIDALITTAKDASAAFGSAQKRVDIQKDFITSLVSSLEEGVSTLTDTDLTAASAELSALQVQQQLGIQSLSIANQTPQSLLSLFR